MAAPAITASTRYTSQGTTKFYWVPTIASPSSPTRAELNAGTDLSPQLADASGWAVKTNQIKMNDVSSRVETQIPGNITLEDSSLTMYMSKNGVDARSLMPRDATGFIVVLDGGDVTSNKCDVYPVTVSAVSKQRQAKGTAADTLMISFAITSLPSENVTVP